MKAKLLLACLFFTAIASAQKTKVTATIPAGLKLQSNVTTQSDMTYEMMGQSLDNKSETVIATETLAKDVTDTGYLFTQTIRRMKMHNSMMGQDMDFDSDKKEDMDGPMGTALKDRIGHPKDIFVDKEGIIVRIGRDSTSDSTEAGEIEGVVTQMVTGQPYPLMLATPGKKKVKPGDSWVDSSGTEATMKTVTAYTVKEISGGEMVISYVSTVAKNSDMAFGGAQLQMELKGDIKGENTYEVATGILEKGTASTNMKGSVSAMGQTIPVTVSGTTTTTVTRGDYQAQGTSL